jgi:hypothetical protein
MFKCIRNKLSYLAHRQTSLRTPSSIINKINLRSYYLTWSSMFLGILGNFGTLGFLLACQWVLHKLLKRMNKSVNPISSWTNVMPLSSLVSLIRPIVLHLVPCFEEFKGPRYILGILGPLCFFLRTCLQVMYKMLKRMTEPANPLS